MTCEREDAALSVAQKFLRGQKWWTCRRCTAAWPDENEDGPIIALPSV